MKTKRFAIAAFVVGILGIALEVLQIVFYDTHLSQEWSYPADPLNHLAFFTVISNLLVDLWLIAVAAAVFARSERFYKFLTQPAVQGMLVLYIAAVGIIYCAFLFWFIGMYSRSLWWANIIDLWNHFILPVTMIVLWFTIPHTQKLRRKALLFWMIFPLTYFLLSEIRGLIFDWYPYPFFRPSPVLFPLGVFISLAFFISLGSLIIWLHNKKAKTELLHNSKK